MINAWASSNSEQAIEKVEALLRTMELGLGHPPAPKPDRITYNTVIKTMGSYNGDMAPSKAAHLLTRLEKLAQHNPDLYPDVYSYTAVIAAYARSNLDDKAEKAFEVLKGMIDAFQSGILKARPTARPFNAALNSCAFVKDGLKSEAFLIAVAIMALLKKVAKPDTVTYGTFLRACSSLLPSSDQRRQDVVESIFREACRKGLVGNLVLQQFGFAATPDQYRRLIGLDHSKAVTLDDLPQEWTINVNENTMKRQVKSKAQSGRAVIL